MSGKKLENIYHCKHSSRDAFAKTDGRYEYAVPEHQRS
jgi:hypothetical protein